MRQLRLIHRPTPAPTPEAKAAAAHAWRVLRALPLPIDLPNFARDTFSRRGLWWILSTALHHADGCEVSCAELAATGHAAAVKYATLRCADDEQQYRRFIAWWVQCSIRQLAEGHEVATATATQNNYVGATYLAPKFNP